MLDKLYCRFLKKYMKLVHERTTRAMYIDFSKTLDSDSCENRYGKLIYFVSNMNNAVWVKEKPI